MTNNLPVKRSVPLFSNNLAAIEDFLRITKPDLVGFQEMDFGSARSYYQNQGDSISKACSLPFYFSSINWDKNYVPFPQESIRHHFGRILSGQAIYSRFPLTATSKITLEKPRNRNFIYRSFYLDRLIQMADWQVGGKTIRVLNLHLEAFEEETRISQAYIVRQLIESLADSLPLIVLGDFNGMPPVETEHTQTMEIILGASGIASAVDMEMYEGNKHKYYTFSSRNPFEMIDYILYNPKFIQKTDAGVFALAGEISDHFPVYMDFKLIPEIDPVKAD